jgi:uncharacterized protein YggE
MDHRISLGSILRTSWVFPPLLAAAACAPAMAQVPPGPGGPQTPDDGGTIQVSGQAQIAVPADRVRISFTVETESASAQEATTRNAELMASVVGALRGAGIPGLDLQTYGYDLRPEYQTSREEPGSRSISRYRVQNNVQVTLDDVDATGQILDLAIEAGANRVANLQFEASDTREAKLQALKDAVTSAREQAEAIAEAMGVGLGPALEVQGGASAPNPRSPSGMMLRTMAETATPIESGESLVSANVTITFRILEEPR